VAQVVGPEFKPQYCKTKNKHTKKSKEKEPGMMVHGCYPCYSGGRGRRITNLKLAWAKIMKFWSQKKAKCGGTHLWSQLVEVEVRLWFKASISKVSSKPKLKNKLN
jgi:hypothetical protein